MRTPPSHPLHQACNHIAAFFSLPWCMKKASFGRQSKRDTFSPCSLLLLPLTRSCHCLLLLILTPAPAHSCPYFLLPLLAPAPTGSCSYLLLPLFDPSPVCSCPCSLLPHLPTVASRWWEQYIKLPWPDEVATLLKAAVSKGKEAKGAAVEEAELASWRVESLRIRRTVVRYMVLSYVLCVRRISTRVRGYVFSGQDSCIYLGLGQPEIGCFDCFATV